MLSQRRCGYHSAIARCVSSAQRRLARGCHSVNPARNQLSQPTVAPKAPPQVRLDTAANPLAALAAEAGLGIMLLGWLFERFDVAAEQIS